MAELYPESHIEIKGFMARHYGALLNLVTIGRYRSFIEKAIEEMNIEPDDKILDLGAGSGYNTKFMRRYLGPKGRILGLDIVEDAITTFRKKFGDFANVEIEKRRIDEPLPYNSSFDKVLTSFVIHGLPHPSRQILLENAKRALKEDGELFILDYGDFEIAELPLYLRVPFKTFECKYAFDYLERNWPTILEDHGFEVTYRHSYFGNFTKLLAARNSSAPNSQG